MKYNIIEDSKKNYYYRGLSEWRNEKGWLTDTCYIEGLKRLRG